MTEQLAFIFPDNHWVANGGDLRSMRTLGYLRLRDQLWLMTIFKYLEICMGPEIFHLSICLGILLESSTPPPVEINISYAFAGTSVRIE